MTPCRYVYKVQRKLLELFDAKLMLKVKCILVQAMRLRKGVGNIGVVEV